NGARHGVACVAWSSECGLCHLLKTCLLTLQDTHKVVGLAQAILAVPQTPQLENVMRVPRADRAPATGAPCAPGSARASMRRPPRLTGTVVDEGVGALRGGALIVGGATVVTVWTSD